MTFGFSAFAAGIDSRTYTCAALQGQIAAQGFVFINNANFRDFVVANASYCGGGSSVQVQRRSVPTTDIAECLVNYCGGASGTSGGGGMGGGM
jgi:hypothetical protein